MRWRRPTSGRFFWWRTMNTWWWLESDRGPVSLLPPCSFTPAGTSVGWHLGF
jgi:hypothetical protein